MVNSVAIYISDLWSTKCCQAQFFRIFCHLSAISLIYSNLENSSWEELGNNS